MATETVKGSIVYGRFGFDIIFLCINYFLHFEDFCVLRIMDKSISLYFSSTITTIFDFTQPMLFFSSKENCILAAINHRYNNYMEMHEASRLCE